jgi:Fe(3+) dicitrate transport protein
LNTELGFRFDKGALHGEVIGYYNNFSNLQGSDLCLAVALEQVIYLMLVQPVKGIELLATYDVIDNRERFKLPVTLSYFH